jgi:hypothetical protein
MADGPIDIIPPVRLCPYHLRRIFNREGIFDKAQRGEIGVTKGPIKPRTLTDHSGRRITGSQEWYLYDPADPNTDIGRAHRYITDQGETGASGLLDPKALTLRGVKYRLVKSKGIPSSTTCKICSGEHPDPSA